MMQKSWILVGVFMGWDTGFKCVSTEKWCFSYITLHPLGVIHNTTGFILLKPRPTRRTFSGWKRTCRSWEVTYWVWPTSQLACGKFCPRSLSLQQVWFEILACRRLIWVWSEWGEKYHIKFFNEDSAKLTHLHLYSRKFICPNGWEMSIVFSWKPKV